MVILGGYRGEMALELGGVAQHAPHHPPPNPRGSQDPVPSSPLRPCTLPLPLVGARAPGLGVQPHISIFDPLTFTPDTHTPSKP